MVLTPPRSCRFFPFLNALHTCTPVMHNPSMCLHYCELYCTYDSLYRRSAATRDFPDNLTLRILQHPNKSWVITSFVCSKGHFIYWRDLYFATTCMGMGKNPRELWHPNPNEPSFSLLHPTGQRHNKKASAKFKERTTLSLCMEP